MHFIRLLVVGGVFVMFGQAAVSAIRSIGCPYGWRQFGRSCYRMVTDTPLNWTEARQVCLDAGSDLAVPNSKTEKDVIWEMQNEFAKNNSKPYGFWLGCAYDVVATGQWNCNDNDQTEYSRLKMKHPDNKTCMKIRKHDGEIGKVNSCPGHLHCFAVVIKDSGHQATPYCLLGYTFKETIIQNPIQCCLACSRDPNCHSFNLSGKMCQLNNVTISQVDADKYLMQNCVYYEYQ